MFQNLLKNNFFLTQFPHTQVVDTTGAGDAFIGAALHHLAAGAPLCRVLSEATRVAGSVSRKFFPLIFCHKIYYFIYFLYQIYFILF
jgi:bifunctional ADP-heptose synthase (sugar kinase/adenylyltransferase)